MNPRRPFSAAPRNRCCQSAERSFLSAWFEKLKPFMSMPGAFRMR